MQPPEYFEAVRAEAESIWGTLESSSVLAGPWHRMFQQVQSPRHVVSELLQNADDSGATWASARVVDGSFVFEHNGRDFTKDEFASLCRFGYSNKRALHTIGFRGVGFKSTFSLGKDIRLSTPTLNVRFSKSRFTEPVWEQESNAVGNLTTIKVHLTTHGAKTELEKNLAEWLTSSASLLFFRNIRTLAVNDTELKWTEVGPGPCPNSAWLKLAGTENPPSLLLRSELEAFPHEALEEIQAERILSEGEHLELPPCSVEILLYGDSRLFVVLPTGVKTKLPFAANAPFVQDTARLKVKDPDSSYTNRWLLERIGRLAAEAMKAWLSNSESSPEFLAQAYDLMPNVSREDSTLEGSCAATAEVAFDSAIEVEQFVLTDTNSLVRAGECLEVPSELMGVWPAPELARILARESQAMASRRISDSNLQKLCDWRAVCHIPRSEIVLQLQQISPAKPQSWKQLLALWSYLSDDIPTYDWDYNDLRGLRVVPVQGQSTLFSAKEVIRLGEKRLLASDDDWAFMSGHLNAYNPNWSRFLAEQRKIAEEHGDAEAATEVDRAFRLQSHLKLNESSDTNQVMRQVAEDFHSAGEVTISDCVRLAQIAARLGAAPGAEFRFFTRNNRLTRVSDGVLADETGWVADIVPASWAEAHLLHDSYWSTWTSCTRQEWLEWIDSGKASLERFPALKYSSNTFFSRREFDAALQSRGFTGTYEIPYKRELFELTDAAFEPVLWEHWRKLAATDERFWSRLVGLILDLGPAFWSNSFDAKGVQVASTGSKRQIVGSGITPSWIRNFWDTPCLVDTRGVVRKPYEVMRRTASTEPLLDVEPFIPVDVDTEANRPFLNALQVRSVPTGPHQILERIQALAEAESPPVEEVEKWYRRLDGLFLSCTSEETKKMRSLFESEPLILSASHGWVRSQEVFLSASAEEVPDTPLIRPSLRDLELWRRIQVAERPNAELILRWLSELPTSVPLPTDVSKRVKSALARLGVTAWEGTGHWLNLSSEFVPVGDIKFSQSMRNLARTQELFPAIKQTTADFQMLDFESLDRYPFGDVPSLASCLDERVSLQVIQSFVTRPKPWLECLAKNLGRIEIPSGADQAKLREAAMRLTQTEWRQGTGLETVPYMDGVPVGAARRVPAVWSGLTLFVADSSAARMAVPVAREIARGFDHTAISDAVKFCFERDSAFILDYLSQEFTLSSTHFDLPLQPAKPAPAGDRAVTNEQLHVTDTISGANQEPDEQLHVTDTISEANQEPDEQLYVTDTISKANPEPDEQLYVTDIISEANPEPDEQLYVTDIISEAKPESAQEHEPVSEQPSPTTPEAIQGNQQKHLNRPEKPSLVERFAALKELRPDGNGKFIGIDGRMLLRSPNSVFPWELRGQHGDLVVHLLPQENCLEREPIMLESEAWSLLHAAPESHALLVLALDGTPTLLTGCEVKEQLAAGKIELYPARYRLMRSI